MKRIYAASLIVGLALGSYGSTLIAGGYTSDKAGDLMEKSFRRSVVQTKGDRSTPTVYRFVTSMGHGCFWGELQAGGQTTRYYSVNRGHVRQSYFIIPVSCQRDLKAHKQHLRNLKKKRQAQHGRKMS